MESLRFLRGISSPPLAIGLDARNYPPPAKISAAVRAGPAGGLAMEAERDELAAAAAGEGVSRRRGNWVLKILRVGSLWSERGKDGIEEIEESDRCVGCGGMDGCDVVGEGEEERVEIDRDSFSRLLRRVTVMEAQLYAKMSYLGSLAYTIPKIKTADLLKFHGLRFVTSSLEKKAKSLDTVKEQSPSCDQQKPEPTLEAEGAEGADQHGENASGISANAAYQIAASAATYLQSQTRGILPFGNSKVEIGEHSSEASSENDDNEGITEIASFVATTNSVTAVVAGKEEMKQAVVKGLNSAHSSPCEWFICDDDKSGTRYFVIQGSESLASWQANLLFEPIQFEGLDVLVHRGIYEAAKGIYEQILPEVQAHLKSRGNSATFRFTGHSLGGSLSLLVNLMLLIRGEASLSSLLPVITFGAPTIMCGGDYLLQKLGLPQSHVQAITMHRDIVPRAFSCNYPDHVAKILKAVNGNFRSHPCLQNQKLLYDPMGKLLILQPEEKFSPHHHLLPAGSGLYLLDHSSLDSEGSLRLLRSAQSAFLNSPHPLEILSDRAAYGSDGTVYRDHDVSSYLRSIHSVIRQELKLIRKARRESRRLLWWPIVAAPGTQSAVIVGHQAGVLNSGAHHFSFAGVLHGGRETLKRFGRMVASQNMRLLIVLLFPARLLVVGTFSLVTFI